jgi:hypothetical protein
MIRLRIADCGFGMKCEKQSAVGSVFNPHSVYGQRLRVHGASAGHNPNSAFGRMPNDGS